MSREREKQPAALFHCYWTSEPFLDFLPWLPSKMNCDLEILEKVIPFPHIAFDQCFIISTKKRRPSNWWPYPGQFWEWTRTLTGCSDNNSMLYPVIWEFSFLLHSVWLYRTQIFPKHRLSVHKILYKLSLTYHTLHYSFRVSPLTLKTFSM